MAYLHCFDTCLRSIFDQPEVKVEGWSRAMVTPRFSCFRCVVSGFHFLVGVAASALSCLPPQKNAQQNVGKEGKLQNEHVFP